MSIKGESILHSKREWCAICGKRELEVVLELPRLPLTGIYCQKPPEKPVEGIDQKLLLCLHCGHAQLSEQVTPSLLYGEHYSFRTSMSMTARQGTDFFLSALNEVARGRSFRCVLDLGCNDLYLLKQLNHSCLERIGIDPVWAGKEDLRDEKSIRVIGAPIEEVDLHSTLEREPDLIVCQHTLEHLYDPRAVLIHLFSVASENALFLFEVPGFEGLVNRFRFDQVFHQHLQYFTLTSFQKLLYEVGGQYISHWENYPHWGALLIAFHKRAKGQGTKCQRVKPPFGIPLIQERYALFRRQMSHLKDILKSFEGTPIYGYGAAQMLPVLAYHLGSDLSFLTAILDDDPYKDGLHYLNLSPVIRHLSRIEDLKGTSIFITAVDNVEPILSKLLARRPRHIISPFHMI